MFLPATDLKVSSVIGQGMWSHDKQSDTLIVAESNVVCESERSAHMWLGGFHK
jgi:hypothetical protein